MKTLSLLAVCALLSVCWSTGVVEPEAVDDHDSDFAEADDAPAVAGPDSSASDDSNSPSSSSSESNSSSLSSESSESDSAASDSASSSSSSSSSSSESSEGTNDPAVDEDAVEVLVKRDLASVLLRRKRATNPLSPLQLESLQEVCELHDGCDEMAETEGIVAAYTAYYGPVPF